MLHNCSRVCACVCVVTRSNSVNRVTLDKRTSERYNFAGAFAIEMYLGKHIYLCKYNDKAQQRGVDCQRCF